MRSIGKFNRQFDKAAIVIDFDKDVIIVNVLEIF